MKKRLAVALAEHARQEVRAAALQPLRKQRQRCRQRPGNLRQRKRLKKRQKKRQRKKQGGRALILKRQW